MAAPDFPPGLHVFERGWLSANNILFTGGDETLLVDSGYCTHAPQTLSLVESALGPRPLDIPSSTRICTVTTAAAMRLCRFVIRAFAPLFRLATHNKSRIGMR